MKAAFHVPPPPSLIVLTMTRDEALVLRAVFGRYGTMYSEVGREMYPRAAAALAIGVDPVATGYAALDCLFGSEK